LQAAIKLTFRNLTRRFGHFRDGMSQTSNQRKPDDREHDRQRGCEREPGFWIEEELVSDKGIGHDDKEAVDHARTIRASNPPHPSADPIPRRVIRRCAKDGGGPRTSSRTRTWTRTRSLRPTATA